MQLPPCTGLPESAVSWVLHLLCILGTGRGVEKLSHEAVREAEVQPPPLQGSLGGKAEE